MINSEGIALVKDFEGCKLKAYKCPAGIWTIGYGHTGPDVKPTSKISQAQANALLSADLSKAGEAVSAACQRDPNPNQLAAMTSLAFNIGRGAFEKSTVLKAHNRGDTTSAGRAFMMWNKARVNGKLVEMPGLVSRRARESALYLKAARDADRTAMPQAVAAPPSTASSQTVVGSGIAGGAVGLAATADAVRQVSDIAYSSGPIIDLVKYAPYVLVVVALLAIGYVIYRRVKQRREGWL
jgi:lysozyme